jgi:hypothetical protein
VLKRVCIHCSRNMFTEWFPRNGHCLQSHHLVMGLYTTI